jgi:tetratricopeptide (TPR) repeat protein
MDVLTCLALATHALNEGNPQAACEFYEVALKLNPNNVDVLEAYGEVLFHHIRDHDRAVQLLQHAAEVCPNEGPVKFSNLAQLSQGFDALGYYAKALVILRRDLAKTKGSEEKDHIRRSIAEAKAAIAELYLTDLCDEPDAEEKCERFVQEAIESCHTCVDAFQTLGSLRLSQEAFPEAKAALARAVDLCEQLEEGLQPAYETRVELGKLLMQVSPRRAFEWLRLVLNLDPENAYVWFLLGETSRMRGRYHDACRLLKHARFSTSDREALDEIDGAIRLTIEEMGGPEAVSAVEHMNEPNPLDFLQEDGPDDMSQNDDDVDSCASDDSDAEA